MMDKRNLRLRFFFVPNTKEEGTLHLPLFDAVRHRLPSFDQTQSAQARFPELHTKIIELSSEIERLKSLLDDNNKHSADTMFQRNKLLLECAQIKLAFYSTIILTAERTIDATTQVLIADYIAKIDQIYSNKTNASFYILHLLEEQRQKSEDAKERMQIMVAKDLCQKKVALLEIAAGLIYEQIMQTLNIATSSSMRNIERLKAEYKELIDFDPLNITYADNNFVITYPIPESSNVITDRHYIFPSSDLLEKLISLDKEHFALNRDQRQVLIDLYACAAVRKLDAVSSTAATDAVATSPSMAPS
jgi:septum formation topological specificity factor MinE